MAVVWWGIGQTMAKYSTGLREEELKLKVAADWFAAIEPKVYEYGFLRK